MSKRMDVVGWLELLGALIDGGQMHFAVVVLEDLMAEVLNLFADDVEETKIGKIDWRCKNWVW